MKRFVGIFLAFLILCSGCSKKEAEEKTIVFSSVSESYQADDGTVICKKEIQTGELILPDTQVGRTIHADLKQVCGDFQKSVNIVHFQAREHYIPGADFAPYTATLTFTQTRRDEKLLSLYSTELCYNGQTTQSIRTHNYDLETGESLPLSQFINPQQLPQLVLNALKRQSPALYPNYEELLQQRFSPDNTAWYLTEDALCIPFAPYTIAPATAGIIVAQIPLASIE